MSEMTAAERALDRMSRTNPGPLVEPSARWVRVKLGDVTVADSRHTLLARQYRPPEVLPTYYFRQEDVRMDLLEPAERPESGGTTYWNVKAGGQVAKSGASMRHQLSPELEQLAGRLTFSWRTNLRWYEEEEEVRAHARDPYHRIDTLLSSRHVEVLINGVRVAETRRPTLLFETMLPTRYYIPQEDVCMELLEPGGKITRCAYKGQASYWSVRTGDQVERDLVWGYMDPTIEASKVKGLLCFFNERVELYVDGELQERPVTPWSRD